ncbi:MAG TPA: hypothetical protein VD997_15040 [Phycisphaerales bacterium]|nr:hypothetical protein [Phycisphaerales bacterium]
MNDRDLNALIRMAQEVEQLEEPAPLRFEWAQADAGARKLHVRKALGGVAALAAAACLGIAAITWMKPAPSGVPGPVATNSGPAAVPIDVKVEPRSEGRDVAVRLASAKGSSPLGAVLLAVFKDSEDRCSCIQINGADFKGDLASIGSSELVRAALESSCHENPQEVLVIAMEGPRDRLPSSTAEAEFLAAAVQSGSSHCSDDGCLTETTGAFLPEGVRAVAGTVALR